MPGVPTTIKRWKVDAASAAVVAGVSLVAAFAVLPRFHDYFFVWDHNFSSAVSLACGRGLAEIQDTIPALTDFLNRRRQEFDCALIPQSVRLGPLNAYAEGIPYFLRGLGLYWRLTGVSWPALAPLFGTLFAVSNVIFFFLCRQFIGTAAATIVAAVYVVSPSNYHSLTYYEHYAKTPIFLSVLLIIVWIVRRCTSSRQLIAASIAGGILIGVGFGIRADLWLLALLFALATLFFVQPIVSWRPRAIALTVFLAVATLVALPAAVVQGSSYFWLQLLQGLSSPFDADLSVRPAVYEWMPQYSDNLGLSWMQTHQYFQVAKGTISAADSFTDAKSAAPGVIEWPVREAAGMSGYLALMKTFPADFITRPLAAVLEVSAQSFRSQPAYAREFGTVPNAFTRSLPFWTAVASASWFPLVAMVLAFLGLAARSKREALFILVAVLYVGGTTAIVFLPRHRWHLYFIGFLAAGVVAQFVATRITRPVATLRRTGTVIASALPLSVSLAVVAVVVLLTTRAYQDRHVEGLIRQLLSADVEPVQLEHNAGNAVIETPTMLHRFQKQAAAADRFQYADYLAATFSREMCGQVRSVKAVYRASQAFFDDTRPVDLDFSHDSASFRFIFPAYEMKLGSNFGHFRGFDLAGARSDCLVKLERFRDPAAFPFLITWHLPEHWQQSPRHQSIVFPSAAQ